MADGRTKVDLPGPERILFALSGSGKINLNLIERIVLALEPHANRATRAEALVGVLFTEIFSFGSTKTPEQREQIRLEQTSWVVNALVPDQATAFWMVHRLKYLLNDDPNIDP